MSTRLHIVVSDELVARIDAQLGPGQPRADWIRRAVEQALGGSAPGWTVEPPAPAEQPREYKGHVVRSSAARPFRPAPKGKP